MAGGDKKKQNYFGPENPAVKKIAATLLKDESQKNPEYKYVNFSDKSGKGPLEKLTAILSDACGFDDSEENLDAETLRDQRKSALLSATAKAAAIAQEDSSGKLNLFYEEESRSESYIYLERQKNIGESNNRFINSKTSKSELSFSQDVIAQNLKTAETFYDDSKIKTPEGIREEGFAGSISSLASRGNKLKLEGNIKYKKQDHPNFRSGFEVGEAERITQEEQQRIQQQQASYVVTRGQVNQHFMPTGEMIPDGGKARIFYYTSFVLLLEGTADYDYFVKECEIISDKKSELKEKFKDCIRLQIKLAAAKKEGLILNTPHEAFQGLNSKARRAAKKLFASAFSEVAAEREYADFPGIFVQESPSMRRQLGRVTPKIPVVVNVGEPSAPVFINEEVKFAEVIWREGEGAVGGRALSKDPGKGNDERNALLTAGGTLLLFNNDLNPFTLAKTLNDPIKISQFDKPVKVDVPLKKSKSKKPKRSKPTEVNATSKSPGGAAPTPIRLLNETDILSLKKEGFIEKDNRYYAADGKVFVSNNAVGSTSKDLHDGTAAGKEIANRIVKRFYRVNE